MRPECRQSQSDWSTDKCVSALHIGKYYPPFSGGIENFLADLLETLRGSRVKTAAIVHDHRPGLRGEITTQSNEGTGANKPCSVSSQPLRLYRVPAFGRMLYAPVSPQFPGWLRRAIRLECPDILHVHLPNTSAFWALSLPEARRLPWVIHWHADVVSSTLDRRLKLAYPLYRPFEQRLLGRAVSVIVSSPPYLECSQALRPWREKCRVVPLGLDPSRIPDVSQEARHEAEAAWGDAGLRILSVGRLTYYKGHEYLIRALQAVPGTRALIVGEGERRRCLQSSISTLGLDGSAVLKGGLPAEQLHALMMTCDCVCLPSVERTEAFGMVLLEAMAHGKPTVVCDIPGSGVSWVVRNGETGLIVPPADPAALSEAFRALRADPAAVSRMGREGRRRYRAMFQIDRVGTEVRQIYEEILEQEGRDD